MRTGLVLRGGADGSFGNATRTALIAFQTTQRNCPQTGVVSDADAKTARDSAAPPTAPQGVAPTGGFAVFGERGARVTALQTVAHHRRHHLHGWRRR